MDEKAKNMVGDIEILKKIKKTIEEDIAKLQQIHSNLEAQSHTSLIKNEQDEKLKNLERMTQYAVEERKLGIKRNEIEARIDLAEQLEIKNKDRIIEIERREQKTLNLEEQISELNKLRGNFEVYKIHIEEQLEKAKIVIAQANAGEEKNKIISDMLLGREIQVKELEKRWNDLIGKLEQDKKQFEIEKENFLGLQKNKEVLNV